MQFPTINNLPQASGQFLKLGDGKSIVGVFRGNPEIFYQVFENGKYKVVKEDYPGSSFRFAINFIVKEEGGLVSKIFQGSWYDYKTLQELHKEYDLEKTYVKISQTGERQTKRMSFMPMKGSPDKAVLSKIELQKIKKNKEEDHFEEANNWDVPRSDEPTPDDLDDIPF